MSKTTENQKQAIPFGITLLVLLLAALFGTNVVAVKVGLQGLNPLAAAGLRFSVALPLLIIWAWMNRISLKLKRREYLPLLLLGLLFAVQIACLNWGTGLTRAGRATVMVNISPVCVSVLAHFLVPGDRLSRRKVIGLALAFGGIFIVFGNSFFDGREGYLPGDLLALLSGFLLGLRVVVVSRLVQYIDSRRLLVYQMSIAVPLFFLLSIVLEDNHLSRFSPSVAAALLYQGAVVGGFCFLTWTRLLKKYSPSRLSVLFFTRPLWGVALSYFILAEPVGLALAAGTLIVALGIYLVLGRKTVSKVEDTVQ